MIRKVSTFRNMTNIVVTTVTVVLQEGVARLGGETIMETISEINCEKGSSCA